MQVEYTGASKTHNFFKFMKWRWSWNLQERRVVGRKRQVFLSHASSFPHGWRPLRRLLSFFSLPAWATCLYVSCVLREREKKVSEWESLCVCVCLRVCKRVCVNVCQLPSICDGNWMVNSPSTQSLSPLPVKRHTALFAPKRHGNCIFRKVIKRRKKNIVPAAFTVIKHFWSYMTAGAKKN